MESLPSYQEATARPDWLKLVAPFVGDARDQVSLCLVSHRFWDVFAPRLWRNFLKSVRDRGLDPGDDLSWWFWFVFTKLDTISKETRGLVRVLDLRHFARESYDFASDENEKTLKRSLKKALENFGNATSLLLDEHEDLDPNLIVGCAQNESYEQSTSLLLLSMTNCHYELRRNSLTSPSLQKLVYLDISGTPGSISKLCDDSLLPHLRVLKARHKEIDYDLFVGLLMNYSGRMWSLDVSDNKILDNGAAFLANCFPLGRLQSFDHFQVEGRLAEDTRTTTNFGSFIRIEESQWSANFNHPRRFFADSPTYTPEGADENHEYQASRHNGLASIRSDTADAATAALSEGLMTAEDFRVSRGLTHLHLSNNLVSAAGIEKLIRLSTSHMEHFSCDSMLLLPHYCRQVWSAHIRLHGILGEAHIFRPVFSPNLQVLRIHHSLVTHIPTLKVNGISDLGQVHLSETTIRDRVDVAYPQTFIPDMNPRLTSLTLTRIPRRSSGPVIDRLVAFLKLLAVQERAIQDASQEMSSSTRRGPGMLKGLRHLRLEFERNAMEDISSCTFWDTQLDATDQVDTEDEGFSFFGNEWTSASTAEAGPGSDLMNVVHSNAAAAADPEDNHHASESDRDDDEYMTYRPAWNEDKHVKVWIGNKTSPPVIRDYRRLVMAHNVRDCAGPATPAQILAGAPEKSVVFHTAWRMAVIPKSLNEPSSAELTGMRDVVAALKAYRQEGRERYATLSRQAAPRPTPLGEPHFFWTGHLEVVIS